MGFTCSRVLNKRYYTLYNVWQWVYIVFYNTIFMYDIFASSLVWNTQSNCYDSSLKMITFVLFIKQHFWIWSERCTERKKEHFNLFQNIFHVVMYVGNDIAKCWDDYQNAFRNQIIRKNQLPSLTSHTYRNNWTFSI